MTALMVLVTSSAYADTIPCVTPTGPAGFSDGSQIARLDCAGVPGAWVPAPRFRELVKAETRVPVLVAEKGLLEAENKHLRIAVEESLEAVRTATTGWADCEARPPVVSEPGVLDRIWAGLPWLGGGVLAGALVALATSL